MSCKLRIVRKTRNFLGNTGSHIVTYYQVEKYSKFLWFKRWSIMMKSQYRAYEFNNLDLAEQFIKVFCQDNSYEIIKYLDCECVRKT